MFRLTFDWSIPFFFVCFVFSWLKWIGWKANFTRWFSWGILMKSLYLFHRYVYPSYIESMLKTKLVCIPRNFQKPPFVFKRFWFLKGSGIYAWKWLLLMQTSQSTLYTSKLFFSWRNLILCIIIAPSRHTTLGEHHMDVKATRWINISHKKFFILFILLANRSDNLCISFHSNK